jgi:hypothetical protein
MEGHWCHRAVPVIAITTQSSTTMSKRTFIAFFENHVLTANLPNLGCDQTTLLKQPDLSLRYTRALPAPPHPRQIYPFIIQYLCVILDPLSARKTLSQDQSPFIRPPVPPACRLSFGQRAEHCLVGRGKEKEESGGAIDALRNVVRVAGTVQVCMMTST